MGGARVGCRCRVLTRGRVPQDGETPLHAAVKFRKNKVVRFLVETGADVTVKTKVGERRVGGEREGVGESRGFGEGWQTALGEPHTRARTTAFWRRQMIACKQPTQEIVVVVELRGCFCTKCVVWVVGCVFGCVARH